MIVSMPRPRPGRSMGDAIDDILAGTDGDAVASKGLDDKLVVPTSYGVTSPPWTSNASSAPPVQPTSGASSSGWDWSTVGSSIVAGIVKGLTPGSMPRPAATVLRPAASSGPSTALIVGGVAAVGLLGFLLLRRRSA